MHTAVLDVRGEDFGHFADPTTKQQWVVKEGDSEELQILRRIAQYMRTSDLPVGFPTETVYGLGADATRSEAVKGIYKAKGRPSDNPLIIHVCDLAMLRGILEPGGSTGGTTDGHTSADTLPQIYRPLIECFWPGPLTILLPNPPASRLAHEVTAGLPTFGVRMPASALALSLISLAGVPLAAPSANASTKPSPTLAKHVLHDLDGRIEYILDGGPCQVGVESTVVDGLCDPPVVLRPGGLSIDEIRKLPGWEGVVKGYKDQSEVGSAAPRAPGMKYKHYSPKAKVVLYEDAGSAADADKAFRLPLEESGRNYGEFIGIIRTRRWQKWAGLPCYPTQRENHYDIEEGTSGNHYAVEEGIFDDNGTTILDVDLGPDVKAIAHGLFSALRQMDLRGVNTVFVEGISEDGDIAAAVMNRLRKAASEIR